MDIILYRARIKGGWLYDMSFNPNVDYEVLKDTRKIEQLEVLTPSISFDKGEEILGKIYGKSIFKRLAGTREFHVRRSLKSVRGMVRSDRASMVSSGIVMPEPEEIARVERCITGKVLTLRRLFEISVEIGLSKPQILDIVQILYCERRIRIIPSTRRVKGKRICSFCEKPSCYGCCMDFMEDDILLYAADNYNIGIPRTVSYKYRKMSESLTRACDCINSFIDNEKKHHATLWCVPGSFEYQVLGETFANVIALGGKVLYITSMLILGEAEEELSRLVEDTTMAIVDRKTLEYKDIDITLCTYNDYPCFHKAFDLVVLDEHMTFLDKALKNMLAISKRAVKESGKLIHITNIPELKDKAHTSFNSELMTIPVNSSRSPIPEPLIVISRLLNESIPEMVIDTVNWSRKENQRMLIFMPDNDRKFHFYTKLTNLMEIGPGEIEFSTPQDKSALMKLRKKEILLVISDDFRDAMNVIEDLNVIVMHADNDAFSKEILMHMSAMAVYHTRKKCGQVIFVVERDNEAVNKTKESIRGINKIAWESGFIKK